MSYIHPALAEHLRKRWERADAYRFAAPGTPEAKMPGYLHPWAEVARQEQMAADEARARTAAEQDEFEREVLRLRADHDRVRRMLADVKFELALRRIFRKYSPDQPRVPAGSREGGQWTSGGGGQGPSRSEKPFRLAAERPTLGRSTIAVIAAQLAKRLIEAYRSENMLQDLFGRKGGTVTYANVDGKDIFGSNSTSPTYTTRDDAAARNMRDVLVQKYPDVMKGDNFGYKPNDALFHAETTILLRAARENGGTLAGRTLEVFADNPMCTSCDRVLPLVGRELGNPTVTFVGPGGATKTMRNGTWID